MLYIFRIVIAYDIIIMIMIIIYNIYITHYLIKVTVISMI
jgi:hypothetical protein